MAAITILIFLQLGLGAAMRHAHAGLSILDFPKAYGHWWPHIHAADLPALNAERTDTLGMPPTSLGQIHLQMTHRLMAGVILLGVIAAAVAVWRRRALLPVGLRWFGTGWPLVLAMQVTLGIYTIWTRKAADVATAHVAVGATSLVWGVIFYAALRRWSAVRGGGLVRTCPRRADVGGGRLMKPAVLTLPVARVDVAPRGRPALTTEEPRTAASDVRKRPWCRGVLRIFAN